MTGLVASTDSLGRFCRLRQAAYRVRQDGGPRMSSDEVLAHHHFTNVVRAQDPGTVLATELLNRHRRPAAASGTLAEMAVVRQHAALWTVLAYRCTNRRAVWEKFHKVVGVYPAADLEEPWLDFLDAERGAGRQVFTGRHYTMGMASYVRTLSTVRHLEPAFVEEMFTDAPTFTKLVQDLPGVGPFFGWQATADLLTTGWLPAAPDHVLVGPGALLALRWVRDARPFREMFNAAGRRVVGATMSHLGQDEARRALVALRDTQAAWLRAWPVDEDRVAWTDHDPDLTLTDLEHALCEYGRWGVYHAQREIRAERAS